MVTEREIHHRNILHSISTISDRKTYKDTDFQDTVFLQADMSSFT